MPFTAASEADKLSAEPFSVTLTGMQIIDDARYHASWHDVQVAILKRMLMEMVMAHDNGIKDVDGSKSMTACAGSTGMYYDHTVQKHVPAAHSNVFGQASTTGCYHIA